MKALIWTGPRQMQIQEVPRPEPAAGELLLQVAAVGICGSELSGYLGHNSLRVPPLIMGHEFCGTVAASGAGAADFRPGDRVVVNPLLSCGECALCRKGLPNLCPKRGIIGASRPGAFAQWVAVPQSACHRLPDSVDDAGGTLVEPLACAVRAACLAQIGTGSSAAVFGAGPIGLLSLAAARRAGATTLAVIDTNPERLKIARAWGADLVINPREQDPVQVLRGVGGGLGVDAIIDAVGLPITRRQAIRSVLSGGRVVFIGLHDDETPVEGNYIVRQEILITGSFAYTPADFATALQLLAQGFIKADPSWVEERPVERGDESFIELVEGRAHAAKIVLRP